MAKFRILDYQYSCIIGCFVYWAVGYPIASGSGNSAVGYTGWFGTFPEEEQITWLFQFVFAATACTIVSGSVAEQCNILPYFIYSVVITGIVYPAVSRWVWYKDGWLATEGFVLEGVKFQDFAGSGVVHLTGAGIALWGAFFSGPRDGIVIATAIFNTKISGTGGAGTILFLTRVVGLVQECKQLIINVIGAAVIMVWACIWGLLIFGTLSKVKILRISEEVKWIEPLELEVERDARRLEYRPVSYRSHLDLTITKLETGSRTKAPAHGC
ncbi:ammonium transporter 2-like [Watersipora subatra]|uniref:ammonium transporter 2-like n=1 Tax=Watersipora subatra TaxID=2589382 RepID=UPI00355BE32A